MFLLLFQMGHMMKETELEERTHSQDKQAAQKATKTLKKLRAKKQKMELKNKVTVLCKLCNVHYEVGLS